MITLDYAIETVLHLPLLQQEMLVKNRYKRQVEARRSEIVRGAKQSLADLRAGKLRPQKVEDIVVELHDEVY